MLRFERLLLADEQSFVPRLTTGADECRHGGSSAIPPAASLFPERFIYDEQPFVRGYGRATGRFWREADLRPNCTSSKVNNRLIHRSTKTSSP
jgi:hypothetical protein